MSVTSDKVRHRCANADCANYVYSRRFKFCRLCRMVSAVKRAKFREIAAVLRSIAPDAPAPSDVSRDRCAIR